MVPGYHLEGPFLNPQQGYAGCHPPAAMTAPDPVLLERLAAPLARPILLITLAPELPGAEALIRRAREMGSVVALGHTAAGMAEVARAAEAGATLSTHLGNGLAPMLPKFANPLIAQLAEDRLSASFIADGVHIPPPALKVLIRAKTPERSILVTDGTAASGAPPGLYRFAGMTIEHAPDRSVRQPRGQTLAGSALTLDQAVRNLVAWGISDGALAIRMASASPAALLAPALAERRIALTPGEVEWSHDLRPVRVRCGDVAIECPQAAR
jgi:N-acetylglucosamine-6-phosphate deacetylase